MHKVEDSACSTALQDDVVHTCPTERQGSRSEADVGVVDALGCERDEPPAHRKIASEVVSESASRNSHQARRRTKRKRKESGE